MTYLIQRGTAAALAALTLVMSAFAMTAAWAQDVQRIRIRMGDRAVTEFNYRISDATAAHVFVGIETHQLGEAEAMAQGFERAAAPFKTFMLRTVREKDLQLFLDLSNAPRPATPRPAPPPHTPAPPRP